MITNLSRQVSYNNKNNNNNNNNNNNYASAIIYDKAIARVHSGHLNDCWLTPGGRQL